MYNFDTKRFQVFGMFDIVLCSSFEEAQRIVTSNISERMEMAGFDADLYEFEVKLMELRTPTLREHERAEEGENELASEREFWNFAYQFECYAKKIDASE